MRTLGILALTALLGTVAAPASAGLAGKCRKACKPLVAECKALAASGKARRQCRKTILGGCKRSGLEACTVATVTTTTLPAGGVTTTTLPSGGGGGGGVMYMDVLDVGFDEKSDPRVFVLQVSIEYGIVTVDAVTQVGLDPATFTVVGSATEAVYLAEPVQDAGDCSADDVVTRDGPPVTCTLRFTMPLSDAQGAALKFASDGLHGTGYWSVN